MIPTGAIVIGRVSEKGARIGLFCFHEQCGAPTREGGTQFGPEASAFTLAQIVRMIDEHDQEMHQR